MTKKLRAKMTRIVAQNISFNDVVGHMSTVYMVGYIWISLQFEADENDVYGDRRVELPLSHKTMRLSIVKYRSDIVNFML